MVSPVPCCDVPARNFRYRTVGPSSKVGTGSIGTMMRESAGARTQHGAISKLTRSTGGCSWQGSREACLRAPATWSREAFRRPGPGDIGRGRRRRSPLFPATPKARPFAAHRSWRCTKACTGQELLLAVALLSLVVPAEPNVRRTAARGVRISTAGRYVGIIGRLAESISVPCSVSTSVLTDSSPTG